MPSHRQVPLLAVLFAGALAWGCSTPAPRIIDLNDAGTPDADAGAADAGTDTPDGSVPDAGPPPSETELSIGARCTPSPEDDAQGSCPRGLSCLGPTWGGTPVCTEACLSDHDCGRGLNGPHVCALRDALGGFCAERCEPGGAPCSRPDDVCVPHRTTGVCVPDCRRAGQGCGPGDRCDQATGACSPTPCTADAECGGGRCERGRCEKACPDDSCGTASSATYGSLSARRRATPLSGTLRVHVLEPGNPPRPISGATVEVDGDARGTSDSQGLVAVEGLSTSAVAVTAYKSGYTARTLAPVDAADVWLELPSTSPDLPEPPEPPAPITIRGRACGLPTDHRPLENGERLVIRVQLTGTNPLALPPFAASPVSSIVESDCGTYNLALRRAPGRYAVVAVAGIAGAADRFEPLTIGVARDVALAPGDVRTDVDVHLDTPLTATQAVEALGLAQPPLSWSFHAYLDLGPDGWFELPEVLENTASRATFARLPASDVGELVFFALASNLGPNGTLRLPYSMYWKRPVLAPGVDLVLGPMLGFPALHEPVAEGPLHGTIAWDMVEGWSPALTEASVLAPQGFDAVERWRGSYTGPLASAAIPPSVNLGKSGDFLYVTLFGQRWSWTDATFDYTRLRDDGWRAVSEDSVGTSLP